MFIRLQINKYFNINQIKRIEIVSACYKNDSDAKPRAYIAIDYVMKFDDDEINDTLWYGEDCVHGRNQFKKDIEVINSISKIE